jgi:prepilin-type N-terminal cleavage/methylation domain-containing protein
MLDSSVLRRRRRAQGFSLVEVLIALTILGIALLLGVQLVLQAPRIVQRMDAERAAWRAIEAVMESVRAGAIPLETSHLEGFVTATGVPAPRDLQIQMTVEPASPFGLYHVTLKASYKVREDLYKKELETMVWISPGGG